MRVQWNDTEISIFYFSHINEDSFFLIKNTISLSSFSNNLNITKNNKLSNATEITLRIITISKLLI